MGRGAGSACAVLKQRSDGMSRDIRSRRRPLEGIALDVLQHQVIPSLSPTESGIGVIYQVYLVGALDSRITGTVEKRAQTLKIRLSPDLFFMKLRAPQALRRQTGSYSPGPERPLLHAVNRSNIRMVQRTHLPRDHRASVGTVDALRDLRTTEIPFTEAGRRPFAATFP